MAEWKTAGKVRMTPKGVHDSTIAYNILDLVSNEDHTMYYIAKQDVPANTLLTNTDYWDVITDISEIPDQISEIEDDVTELKSAITPTAIINHELSLSITSDMMESGRIDDSGNPVPHSNRCRTKYFIPVSAGDTIILVFDNSVSTSLSAIITYYDTTYTYVSNTGWLYFNNSNTKLQIAQQNGYIRVTFSTATFDTYSNRIMVSRTSQKHGETLALSQKLQTVIDPIPATSYKYGYWLGDGTYRQSDTRVMSVYPIAVHAGDEVHFTQLSSLLIDIGFKAANGSTVSVGTYSNMPFKAPSDGFIYLNYMVSGGGAIADYSALDRMLTIIHATEIPDVEYASSGLLYNGHVNTSGVINSHSTRLVNWRPIHANKGDIVRINYLDICVYVYEFDRAKTLLASSGNYIYPIYKGGNYQLSGDYIVQNDDCWIMCTIAPDGAAPASFTPDDYDGAICVIHREKDRANNTAHDTMWHYPKAPRKGRTMQTAAIASQGMTFVDGDLWAAVDDTNDYINVIDVSTGAIKRTISHNLGHCNSLDYCPDTDCIITTTANGTIVNPKIIIVPNVSAITDSIELSSCIQITVDPNQIDLVATICFGQDKQEAWIYTGYGSANRYDLYKIILDYANGAYTGNILTYTKYTGVIRDNIDTHVMTGMTNYAQDCCYDGYLYLGYGTAGHNFVIIDIDDNHKTYRVVGNCLHKMYDDAHAEFGVEPEGIAINDGKVYCSSRSNSRNLSFFMVFDR